MGDGPPPSTADLSSASFGQIWGTLVLVSAAAQQVLGMLLGQATLVPLNVPPLTQTATMRTTATASAGGCGAGPAISTSAASTTSQIM